MAIFLKKSIYASFGKEHTQELVDQAGTAGGILEPKLHDVDVEFVKAYAKKDIPNFEGFEGYRLTVVKFDTRISCNDGRTPVKGVHENTCTYVYLPYQAGEDGSIDNIVKHGKCKFAIMACPRGDIAAGSTVSQVLDGECKLKVFIDKGFKQ